MDKKPTISLIAAIGPNRELGKDNRLLWSIPEDMRHFRETTSGHPVIMGEKTFRSIGRPLSNRTNIILTRQPDLTIPGCLIAHSVEQAIELAAPHSDEIFFIGGGQVYKQSLPFADKLYLTLVEGNFDADTFFPEYENDFEVVSTRKSSDENYSYQFMELKRKNHG